jgi:hypothetical protein
LRAEPQKQWRLLPIAAEKTAKISESLLMVSFYNEARTFFQDLPAGRQAQRTAEANIFIFGFFSFCILGRQRPTQPNAGGRKEFPMF